MGTKAPVTPVVVEFPTSNIRVAHRQVRPDAAAVRFAQPCLCRNPSGDSLRAKAGGTFLTTSEEKRYGFLQQVRQ